MKIPRLKRIKATRVVPGHRLLVTNGSGEYQELEVRKVKLPTETVPPGKKELVRHRVGLTFNGDGTVKRLSVTPADYVYSILPEPIKRRPGRPARKAKSA